MTSGPDSLLATLTRHGLPDTYYTTNFTDGDLIYSQNGYPILVTRRNGSIFLNDAKLVGTDFIASSGAVHALDRVCDQNTISCHFSFPEASPPLVSLCTKQRTIHRSWASSTPRPMSPPLPTLTSIATLPTFQTRRPDHLQRLRHLPPLFPHRRGLLPLEILRQCGGNPSPNL